MSHHNQYNRRFSDEQWKEAIENNITWKDIAEYLGLTPNGSSYASIRWNAKRLGISIHHCSARKPKDPNYIKKWKAARIIVIDGTKTCSDCLETKDINEFYPHKGGAQGRNNICKKCSSIKSRYYQIKKDYGLDKEKYNEMLKAGCQICGNIKGNKGKRLSVDHCHKTNRIRGILCDSCNFMLGNAKDDPSILENAIKYLTNFK